MTDWWKAQHDDIERLLSSQRQIDEFLKAADFSRLAEQFGGARQLIEMHQRLDRDFADLQALRDAATAPLKLFDDLLAQQREVAQYEEIQRAADMLARPAWLSLLETTLYQYRHEVDAFEALQRFPQDSVYFAIAAAFRGKPIKELEASGEQVLSSIDEYESRTKRAFRVGEWFAILSFIFVLLQYFEHERAEERIANLIRHIEVRIGNAVERTENQPRDSWFVRERTAKARVEPRAGSRVLSSVTPNQQVRHLRHQAKWLLIEYFDARTGVVRHGWVLKKYLSRLGGAPEWFVAVPAVLLVAGISALSKAIDVWVKRRDGRQAFAAFDEGKRVAHLSNAVIQESRIIDGIIPPDILDAITRRAQRCWSQYREVLQGAYLPGEIDEATESVKACICRELNRILKLGQRLPPGQLSEWWQSFCRGSNSTGAT
jgi:hypothetical protein